MPKEFLTYQQQMEKLRSSGLTIEDEEACFRVLADIGGYRQKSVSVSDIQPQFRTRITTF